MSTTDRSEASTPVIDPDYPMTPVPAGSHKSLWSLLVVLLGFTVFTPTMLAGASLGTAFAFGPLLGVIVAGSAMLGVYVAVMGYVGSKTRLTTVMMARYAFGSRGSKLASFLLGGTQVGWYGVVVGTIGDLTAQALGWQDQPVARAVLIIVPSALMCATALRGYKGMYIASAIATPLALVLAFWVAARSVSEVGGLSALFAQQPTAQISVAVAITTVVGTFVSAGTQVPNWTRFARTGRDAVVACVAAFFIGNGLMIVFGAVGAVAFGLGDYVEILYALGLVVAGVVLLFGNLWTTNTDTAYAFGVAGAEMFDRPTKAPFIIGGTIIATLLALFGIQNYLIDYLGLLGTFIPPVGGVIIADYLRRRRHGLPPLASLPRFDVRNLAAYAVAGAAAYASSVLEIGIPPVIGVVVAMALVLVLPRPAEPAAASTASTESA
jgi:cytosine permease